VTKTTIDNWQKRLTYGFLYGQFADTLVRHVKVRYRVEMTEKQAAKTRAVFFKHYDGLARWHAKAWGGSGMHRSHGGRTLLGRRRLLTQTLAIGTTFKLKQTWLFRALARMG